MLYRCILKEEAYMEKKKNKVVKFLEQMSLSS